MSEPQYPSTGGPAQVTPSAPPPVSPPAAPPTVQSGWGQPQPAQAQPAQPGWGQPPPALPQPAQPGWVQPAQVQAPGHSMGRVMIAALFVLAAGGWTLALALTVVVGGGKLSDLLNSQQFPKVADTLGGALVAIGVVMLVWALLEILVSLGMFLRRTWGRALGTLVGLFGGLFMTLILFGSLGALRAADTVGPTGTGGALLVAIVAGVFAGYWFTLLACITGGPHFRRG